METTEMVNDQEVGQNAEMMDWEGRKEVTDKLIYNHTLGAMGVGLVPMPVVDVAALTAVQIRLIYKLAQFYSLEFSNDKAKNIIAALISSVVPVSVAIPLASMMKFIPVIGTAVSVLIMPATGGACTYALGRVFVQHFESGGTFLEFDPASVKAHFAELYKEGKKVAADLKKAKVKAE